MIIFFLAFVYVNKLCHANDLIRKSKQKPVMYKIDEILPKTPTSLVSAGLLYAIMFQKLKNKSQHFSKPSCVCTPHDAELYSALI